ncbi:cell division cycle 6 [Leptinotarsa decemlineata]|uniref:cell division cycle 6 n=1 Tax=Leptinotarsa decemlineata TaxID=7539 RepID=UPI003D308DDE
MKMNTRSSTRKTQSVQSSQNRTAPRKIPKALSSCDYECKADDNETANMKNTRKIKSRANNDLYVSPPKQRKTVNTDNSDTFNTSSNLFEQLSLKSPIKNESKKQITKLNYDTVTETCSEELVDVKDYVNVSKNSIGHKSPLKRNSVYQSARQALHSTAPTNMPGRENELKDMRSFIKNHLENKSSGSMYVSGPPGTGKTASLNMILKEDDVTSKLTTVYVNCTAIKSPTAIYSRIVSELNIKVHGRTEKDYLLVLENYLKRKHKMILLVLDEIDQLDNKNQSILYTIFEWPSKPNSQLILIGIANALDLTDRILPRLQARCELKPTLMHFAPYTKQQIIEIFTSRLKSAGVLDVFSPPAIQMLAGKVAAISGDVRRALDIGRRVVELVDQSRKGEILKPIENLAKDLIEDEMKTVELKEVLNVLNNVYGTSQNLNEETEESFPLQQKILICSLLLILKKGKNKDVTVGKLHEVYGRACKKRNIQAVDQAEFVGLCSLLETRGIIRVSGKKEPRLHKVCLEWNEEEVNAALKDKQLMSIILQDDSCLGK